MNEKYENLYRLTGAEANLHYNLHVFGDFLAEREGYKTHSGIEAIHYYLCMKHHWMPSAVRSMSPEDLRFIMQEELKGWTLPKDALP